MRLIHHVALVAFAAGIGLSSLGASCAGPACAIIDVAHSGCAVLVYQDERGVEHRVELTRDDLVSMGRAAEARRRDAGTP